MGVCKQLEETIVLDGQVKVSGKHFRIPENTLRVHLFFLFLRSTNSKHGNKSTKLEISDSTKEGTPAHWNMLRSSFYCASSDSEGLHWL